MVPPQLVARCQHLLLRPNLKKKKELSFKANGGAVDITSHIVASELQAVNWTAFPNLVSLDLSGIYLQGAIPENIGALIKLTHLNISNNNLTDKLPRAIASLTQLVMLDVSSNSISGQIPEEIDNLKNLVTLKLGSNNFNGLIPKEIGNLKNLLTLDRSSNNFGGSIPTSFGLLSSLIYMQLSSNFLIDDIPREIGKIENLTWLDLSYNRLTGPLPPMLDIIQATEDFDIRWCIGTGAYGNVYRAQLPSGKIVAFKKIHRLESQEPSFDRSFRNEIKMLTEIRHKNIVKLYGFCLHNRCMFLVYEYMDRVSLIWVLSNDDKARELNWSKRVNIIKGIVNALSYMHHDCTSTFLHRDISSSNVLLNSELEAFVSDLGQLESLTLIPQIKLYLLELFYMLHQLLLLAPLDQKRVNSDIAPKIVCKKFD
ncbi:hypothetical protein L6164_002839 [Bauhinia variegata]|uniref:Uncharacterized protein n=1 Tax=Bauhinia variegata TaxID=167791 RepID=A0ACB9Q0X9_BAUVA|nr:hypothetical protein L6164_002839 [Bauhinia variegata]